VSAPQSRRFALAGLVALAAVALAPDAWAVGSSRIELPTPADAAGPKTPLIVPRAGEVDVSTLPGPVDDEEVTRIALGPNGAVAGVTVSQTLTLRGVGDFNVVLPGPALHVVGPAEQATQPGLRRGTILWQGFVPGSRTLRSTATLDPAFERFRVPLLVSVRFLQDGREVKPPVTGPVEIQIAVSNNTSRLVPIADGTPRAAELADLLEALRAELRAGRAPVAGKGEVPTSLASTSEVALRRVAVKVPFRVAGSIAFESGSIAGLRVAGPGMPTSSGRGAAFRAVLPSTVFRDGVAVVRLVGEALRLGPPHLEMSADNALPEPAQLAPPGEATWARALVGAGRAELRGPLEIAQTTMWQALRLAEFEAYLGNPGSGSSSTRYEYVSASAVARPTPVQRGGVKVGAVVLVLVAAALAIRNAAVLWARS
jgi:hypothetical protein